MFIGEMIGFQTEHEDGLLRKCADHNEVVLCAPTGSGKTVLACRFIDDYLDENPHTVFLWLCPGAGGLEKQSQETFQTVIRGIDDGDVYSFISDPDPRGKVFFINWDKINKKSNIVLSESENRDLLTKVQFCHNEGIDIFMLIDEEHKYRDTANKYVEKFKPIHVLRISATPISAGDSVETITDDEVIAAGLIAEGISINEGLSKAIEDNNNEDDDLLLIKMADNKRKEVQSEYDKLNVGIRPLVLIQFPNGSEEWIERVKKALAEMGYDDDSEMVTSWFSGNHPNNPEEIKKLNGLYSFLLFKQAIATGWDCPRAKILVKLREGGTEQFNIQTIGRIRRMPEKRFYNNEVLDNCYLYTLDSQFTEGLTSSLSSHFYSAQYHRKFTAPNFTLEKETLNGNDRFSINPESVVKVIREAMLKQCDLNSDGVLDKDEMRRTKGYDFSTKLKSSALEGVARTTHDIVLMNNRFGVEHEIHNSNDGFIIRDAKRRIAAAIGVDEHITNNALRILFGPEDLQMSVLSEEDQDFERKNKLLHGMTLREYNAFLVNNRDILIKVFKDVDEREIGELKKADITLLSWSIPPYQSYKYHKTTPVTCILNKNVFEGYGNNILRQKNRTVTEIAFEYWCEQCDSIKCVYKNGDKGDDYFSIVFSKAFRRNHFYPDYIIQTTNGDIWIIEAKGGETPDGDSNNIDKYARRKFEALKEYAEKHPEIKWGFVRAVDTKLYLSNTEWSEYMSNYDIWKPIESFF